MRVRTGRWCLPLLLGVWAASPTGCGDEREGDVDDAATPDAGCVLVEPFNPSPAGGATIPDPTQVTQLAWEGGVGVTGFDVFVGTDCPPPPYPDAAFTHVEAATIPVALGGGESYCWQIVSTDEQGCSAVGPVWTFQTEP